VGLVPVLALAWKFFVPSSAALANIGDEDVHKLLASVI
jgi:hypothetical protein